MFWSKEKPQSTIVRVEAHVQWIYRYDPVTKEYLGICPPLNLNAAGATFQEMQSIANESAAELFALLLESGDLDAFLRARGWRVDQVPPPGVRPTFDVPADWQRGAIPQLMAV